MWNTVNVVFGPGAFAPAKPEINSLSVETMFSSPCLILMGTYYN
jgi:hypothetical protein